jgi:hypothetical protein
MTEERIFPTTGITPAGILTALKTRKILKEILTGTGIIFRLMLTGILTGARTTTLHSTGIEILTGI